MNNSDPLGLSWWDPSGVNRAVHAIGQASGDVGDFVSTHYGEIAEALAGGVCIAVSGGACLAAIAIGTALKVTQDIAVDHASGMQIGTDVVLGLVGGSLAGVGGLVS